MENENIIRISSINQNSACLILTENYIVIKGLHYNIFNWSTKKRKDAISIFKDDIQDIGYVTIRSKKIVLCFVLVASGFLALGKKMFDFRRLISGSGRLDVNNKFIYRLMESSPESLKRASVIIMVGLILWLLVCVALALACFFYSHRLLRITFVGGMVGVETKYYDKMQLNNLVTYWKKNGMLIHADI